MNQADPYVSMHCPVCGAVKHPVEPVCDSCLVEANGAEFWKRTARKQSSVLAAWATNTVIPRRLPDDVADLLRDLITVEHTLHYERGLAEAVEHLAARARRIVEA